MNWKKTLVITFNVTIGIYLLLAVTAFNKPADREQVCRDVHVAIEKGSIGGFLTADDVRCMLTESHVNPVGRLMADVNLRQMEESLEKRQLVKKAECYKTQGGSVSILVTERIPVVRILADDGDDYYVDKDGFLLQNTGYSCNLMVATGSISRPYASRVLAPVGRLVMADDFWRNQIVQVNVLPDSTLEMVPRVGDHILCLGQPVGITKKLERLRKFYLYGLTQVGWNKYSRISVEYANQIVCKKK